MCIHIDAGLDFHYTHLYCQRRQKSTAVMSGPVGPPNPMIKRRKSMETKVSEIANGIYRLSTFVPEIAPPAGFTFNQFLVLGDEPLLFHTGLRKMFPLIRSAVSRLIPPDRLRWIAFGHYEADECGAMNEWLAVSPQAEVAHAETACLVSLTDV